MEPDETPATDETANTPADETPAANEPSTDEPTPA